MKKRLPLPENRFCQIKALNVKCMNFDIWRIIYIFDSFLDILAVSQWNLSRYSKKTYAKLISNFFLAQLFKLPRPFHDFDKMKISCDLLILRIWYTNILIASMHI